MSKLFFCEDFLLEDHRNSVPDCPFCRGMELEEETNRLQAKLSLYTSWQPSDPGTKEAMEWVTNYGHLKHPVGEDRAFLNEAAKRLAHALRAAMVRLEEAEKGREGAIELLGQCAFYHSDKRLDGSQGAMSARSLVLDFLTRLHGFPRGDDGQSVAERRAEAAESQVAALTASLASMTKELEETKRWLQEEGARGNTCRAENAALMERLKSREQFILDHEECDKTLAELRKRMGEAEKMRARGREMSGGYCADRECKERIQNLEVALRQYVAHDVDCVNVVHPSLESECDCRFKLTKEALASPPSPAPVAGAQEPKP